MKNRSWMLLALSISTTVPRLAYADTAALSIAEGAAEPAAEDSAASVSQPNWLDSSHAYAGNAADALAGWIDRFFGGPRADVEAADSALRVSAENVWEEGNGNSESIKLRGKLYLPRIDKRLSLVFTDEESEDSEIDSDISSVTDEEKETEVELQYNIRNKKRSRLDFSAGLQSSLKGKANLRYRYEIPWGEYTTNRFTQALYFVDGEGLGSRSRYELDRVIDKNRLLRWANNIKFAEDIDGVEWTTRLLLGQRLNNNSALSYFVWSAGETRPDYLTTSYGLGTRYRRSFYRPWLFYELEPAYAWQRPTSDEAREGRALFTLRVEMLW